MKLLLLLACLTVCLCTALVPPPPQNLYVSSVNFRHVLHWTPAPDSPPGLEYRVYIRCRKALKEVASSNNTWAAVKLDPKDTYRLCVRSYFNSTFSGPSKFFTFTPYVTTNITAPNVTVSGCGTCIEMNISLPKPHHESGLQDIRHIYNLDFIVSLRKTGQESMTITKTEDQNMVIHYLSPGTEYCVQVKPHYLEKIFQPSSWTCAFTSPAQSSAFAAMVSAAVLVVFILLAVVLVLFGLQYTGIICKLREARPLTLITILRQHSLLMVEKTLPEPVSLPLQSERQQHSPWYQEEEQEEDQEEDQENNQKEQLYMDPGMDLSSDSSLKCGHMTTSSESATNVADNSEYQSKAMDQQNEEKEQIIKLDDGVERRSLNSEEELEWRKELERDEGVNLLSVTVATALDIRCVEELPDEPALLQTPCHTPLPLPPHDIDVGTHMGTNMGSYMGTHMGTHKGTHKDIADVQEESSYYMRH